MMAAPVSMERLLEMPHAAAGPLVTPTNPIFRTSLAAAAVTEPNPIDSAITPYAVAFRKVLREIIGSSRGSQFVDNDMTIQRIAGSILPFTSIQLTRLKMIG